VMNEVAHGNLHLQYVIVDSLNLVNQFQVSLMHSQ
jgi:hypothetical protein